MSPVRGSGIDKMTSQSLRCVWFRMLVGSFPLDLQTRALPPTSLAPLPFRSPGAPSPLTASYMTGPSSPISHPPKMGSLQSLHTFTSDDSRGSSSSPSVPAVDTPLCTQLSSYAPELPEAPTFHLSRAGCCVSPCQPAPCPVSSGQKAGGHL